jgi:hypothetical protein
MESENKMNLELKGNEQKVMLGINILNLIIFGYIYKYSNVDRTDFYIMLFSIVGMAMCALKTLGVNISKTIMIINHYWFLASVTLFGLFSTNKHILVYILYLLVVICSLKLIYGQCVFSKLHDNDWDEKRNVISKLVSKINLEHFSLFLSTVIIIRLFYQF